MMMMMMMMMHYTYDEMIMMLVHFQLSLHVGDDDRVCNVDNDDMPREASTI
jgi:hypothetical protein